MTGAADADIAQQRCGLGQVDRLASGPQIGDPHPQERPDPILEEVMTHDPSLVDKEQMLLAMLADVQRKYQSEAKPIIDKLVDIEARKPPKPWFPEMPMRPPGGRAAIMDQVLRERMRQIDGEGFGIEKDDEYVGGEMAMAAACYAMFADRQGIVTPTQWPWSPAWFKQKSRRRDLVRAAALLVAEIELIERAEINHG
jgi:hypothetical protein